MPVKEEGEEKGGYLLGSSSSKRQRFYIELKPDETTIVSWKKLLRDSNEIDQCHKSLDENSDVGQRSKSHFQDERVEQRTRVRLPDKEEQMDVMVPIVEPPEVEGKKNGGLIGKSKDYGKEFRKANANARSMLQHFLSRFDTSAMGRDHQLEKLHDVPVLMYSKKSSTYSGILSHSSPLNVPKDATVFPLKTKHDTQHKTQRPSSEKSTVNMKAANDSSVFHSQNSARRSAALQTYHRSRNLLDRRKHKLAEMSPVDQLRTKGGICTANGRSVAAKNQVQSMVHNDNLVGLVMETNVTRNPVAAPSMKRKFTDSVDGHILNTSPCNKGAQNEAAKCPSLLAKRSQHAKVVKFKLSSEGTARNVGQQPHLKEPKLEVREKSNVKIKFHLKPEHENPKPKLNHTRAASPLTCKQPNSYTLGTNGCSGTT